MVVMSLRLSSCEQGTIGRKCILTGRCRWASASNLPPSNNKNLVPIAPQTSTLIPHTHWPTGLRITNEALKNYNIRYVGASEFQSGAVTTRPS
jgi:hypothetical protein